MSTLLTVTVWRLVTDTVSHNNVEINSIFIVGKFIQPISVCYLFIFLPIFSIGSPTL